MTLRERLAAVPIGGWVELFIVSNLAFLGADIVVAHAANAFARREEWIPIAFSAAAPVLLLPGLVSPRLREAMRPVAFAVAVLSIVVGVAGMLYHLQSGFFEEQSLHHLVYTAPFVAPLSYVGVGLLLLLNRMEPWGSLVWARWVVFLALGGFVGNLALSLLDHAQNGFFRPTEWIAVGAAAFGSSFLLLVVLRYRDAVLLKACAIVLVLEVLVGVLGFVLHVEANVSPRPGATWVDRFVYGAPAFAPLLFADLAVLAGLGLWAQHHALRGAGADVGADLGSAAGSEPSPSGTEAAPA